MQEIIIYSDYIAFIDDYPATVHILAISSAAKIQ